MAGRVAGPEGPSGAAAPDRAPPRLGPRSTASFSRSKTQLSAIALTCAIGAICLLLVAPTHSGTASANGSTLSVSGSTFVAYNGPLGGSVVSSSASPAPVWLTLTLAPSNLAALNAFDAAVIDPQSPLYNHFLSEAQFDATYSPQASTVAAVQSYFGSYGASAFRSTPDGLGVSFQMPSAGASQALGTTVLPPASAASASVVGLSAPPRLPQAIAHDVLGVGELVSVPSTAGRVAAPSPQPVDQFGLAKSAPNFESNNGTQLLWGSDYTQLFGTSQLFPARRRRTPRMPRTWPSRPSCGPARTRPGRCSPPSTSASSTITSTAHSPRTGPTR